MRFPRQHLAHKPYQRLQLDFQNRINDSMLERQNRSQILQPRKSKFIMVSHRPDLRGAACVSGKEDDSGKEERNIGMVEAYSDG
ncbi:hypothetical protein L1987_18874 [Smallanthus sonchifolius]|uniref:Uncharacterized protein n=1 Tax=Smallanthus sonchifolius TaxID=185202 RepID=A0ACB9J1Y4_9ASTR|nr:hypothetical protein L1987_18874 [Smallanthus sonchifolius]